MAEEADACAAKAAHSSRSVDPLAEGVPSRVAVEQCSGHRPVRDPRSRERACDLGDATGGAVGEPLTGRHRLVVERARRLEVEDHDRRVDRLHGREHLRGRRVRRRVEEHEIDARAGEQLAGDPRTLGRVDEPGRDDLDAQAGKTLLDASLICLEPLAQSLELRPVGSETDPEDADPRPSLIAPPPACCGSSVASRTGAA